MSVKLTSKMTGRLVFSHAGRMAAVARKGAFAPTIFGKSCNACNPRYGLLLTRSFSSESNSSNSRKSGVSNEQDRVPGRVVVITSGKGGVGKTTTAASFAYGLAEAGHRTCVIDFDIGLRNLDLHLGCERRVIFDFVNVIEEQCSLNQALIQDRRNPLLYLLAASQTKDKDALTEEGVTRVIQELQERFDYVLCDSPAGIESGARHAMFLADEALIVTNPEVSSCRDSDKMVGFIASRSKRAMDGKEPVRQTLIITRYDPVRAEGNDMLHLNDIQELLGLKLLGVIPESKAVLTSTNVGQPVILAEGDNAAEAYKDAVARFLGEERELRYTSPPVGLLRRLFSGGG